MFDILFLGTAASRPTAERGLASLMVFHEAERFLVDCGEGTQRQMMRAGTGFRRLNRILLTHGHLDHVLGLAGLIASLSEQEPTNQVTIYGPEAAVTLARRLLEDVVLPEASTAIDLGFVELAGGETIACDDIQVHCMAAPHRDADSLAYLFEEAPHRHFDAAAADRLGIPEGGERRRLVAGEPVILADGREILPDAVLGPPRPGTRLLVVGDVGDTGSRAEFGADVDALVIEATYLEAERDRARHYGHLTARDAARFAGQVRARALYLTHISARYRGDEILAEARETFVDAELAEDLMRVSVGGPGASAR